MRAKTESGHEKAVSVCAAADVAPMGVVPLLEYRGSTVLARCYDFCSPSFAPTKSEDHKLGQAWSAEGVRGSEASTEESGHALQERAAGVLSTLACISGERRAAEGSRGAADDADAVVLYYVVIGGLFGGFKGGEVSRGSAAVSRRSAIAQCGRSASNYRCCWWGLCECCSPGEARS